MIYYSHLFFSHLSSPLFLVILFIHISLSYPQFKIKLFSPNCTFIDSIQFYHCIVNVATINVALISKCDGRNFRFHWRNFNHDEALFDFNPIVDLISDIIFYHLVYLTPFFHSKWGEDKMMLIFGSHCITGLSFELSPLTQHKGLKVW